MNTPPKIKRYDAIVKNPGHAPPGEYSESLLNPEVGALVAQVTAEFVHLEGSMAYVLAVLLEMEDPTGAWYVLRSIKSPRARVDVMKDLLEKSPLNVERSAAYDKYLGEFWRINKRRNAYVHGTWYTSCNDNSAWLAEEDEHGVAFMEAHPVRPEDLSQLLTEIKALREAISEGPRDYLFEQQRRTQERQRRESEPKSRLGRRPRP
jgi:hypothetical protein